MAVDSLAESQKQNLAQHDATTMETLAMAYAASGDKGSALKIVRELQGREQREYISTFNLSYVYLFLKERDKALEELNEALERHDMNVSSLKVDPLLDPLRGDPRFQSLLKRANLARNEPFATSVHLLSYH
jgi:tetratricopeptide (TPR) repeat protein